MEPKVRDQVQQILAEVDNAEELARIERVIQEAKRKLVVDRPKGFWAGKTPCWEMLRCPKEIRDDCPAAHFPEYPCWQIQGTYCKLDVHGSNGSDTGICRVCRVYNKWGEQEPLDIKLTGKGMATGLGASAAR